MRFALAQCNPTVGDLNGNAAMAHTYWQQAANDQADCVVFPEMFLSGYQIQDLVTNPAFLDAVMDTLLALAKACFDGPTIIVGAPCTDTKSGHIYNSGFVLAKGEIVGRTNKHHLPNTKVFDEKRYFTAGHPEPPLFQIAGATIGIAICEDAWCANICQSIANRAGDIVVVINGSPYARTHTRTRFDTMQTRVQEIKRPLVYVNMVGGQDEQVFDGSSFALDANGQVVYSAPCGETALGFIDCLPPTPTPTPTNHPQGCWTIIASPTLALRNEPNALLCYPHTSASNDLAIDYRMIALGITDYVHKSGFRDVVIGLSGGIDSALVATLASDALGAKHVHCTFLPTRYSSTESHTDARACAQALGCDWTDIDIDPLFQALQNTLSAPFAQHATDTTEENMQSRLRCAVLMALSNKFGWLVLTTGNKSELAVGYATLYGDMAGAFNPLKDIYKTNVFALSKWRNQNKAAWMQSTTKAPIPNNIITKAPSAELSYNQRDEDTLPPYSVLDRILRMLIDDQHSVRDIINVGYDPTIVKAIAAMVYKAEYKRFQSPPGVRLSICAFGSDRRYPIINHWRDQS